MVDIITATFPGLSCPSCTSLMALHSLVYSHLRARFSRTTYSIISFLTFNKNFRTYFFIQLKFLRIWENSTRDRKPRRFGAQGGPNDINR